MDLIVHGVPVPQGSKKIVRLRGSGRTVIIDDNGRDLKAWRASVSDCARLWNSMNGGRVIARPFAISVAVKFWFVRPKTSRREKPTVPPDLDKLERAVYDGLTGYAYEDDSQIVESHTAKDYGPKAYAEITVRKAALL